MTGLNLTTEAATISPLALFLHADLVVKTVMLGLLLASLATWAIIVSQSLRFARVAKANARFEAELAAASDIDKLHRERAGEDISSARVFGAAIEEWRRSTKGPRIDRDGTRSRLAVAMQSAVAAEIDELSDRLNILATIGSIGPFVGLFGTVWGIMRSFSDIAASQNTSFGAVAPGIAEALFATAMGLFAAIPAVVAYNRMSHRLDRIEAGLNRFADRFHGTLSRELDQEPA